MAELTYTKVGDYYIPDLILDEEPEQDVFYGKYGGLRRDYLREHKPRLWAVLVNNGTLADHLKGIERAAEQRIDTLLPEMMKAAGVTEELKARDQMAWVGLVNNCRARVEEIIMADLIYV
jgi:hypothetical protein